MRNMKFSSIFIRKIEKDVYSYIKLLLLQTMLRMKIGLRCSESDLIE